jgi:hypothetical protein
MWMSVKRNTIFHAFNNPAHDFHFANSLFHIFMLSKLKQSVWLTSVPACKQKPIVLLNAQDTNYLSSVQFLANKRAYLYSTW